MRERGRERKRGRERGGGGGGGSEGEIGMRVRGTERGEREIDRMSGRGDEGRKRIVREFDAHRGDIKGK